MLTIQPNFTTKQNYTKPLHFKGKEITEEYVNEQRDFYEKQIKEADKLLENERSPKTLKKGVRLFKIISEGILEGWAVFWGATQGAKIAKSNTLKAVKSNTMRKITKGAKRFGRFLSKNFEKFGIEEKTAKLAEKLEGKKYGKYIVKAAKAVIKAIKKVFGLTQKASDKLKEKDLGAIYDKVTNGTATTLSVGSGVAGSYSASKRTAPIKDEPESHEAQVEKNEDFELESPDDEEEFEYDGGEE